MKRMIVAFSLSVFVLCLTVGMVAAQDPYALPVGKVAKAGSIDIEFEGTVYHFQAETRIRITLERYDAIHVKVTATPVKQLLKPYYIITVQWDDFPPCVVELETEGGDYFLLNSETGYAEK